MTTNPASSRTPADRGVLRDPLAAGSARSAAEARASKTPGDASRAPGERFGTTMSRALERATEAEARDDPGTETPDDAKTAARDDSAVGTDAVAALLASADAASIAIHAPAPASVAEPVPAAVAGGDTPASATAADGDALASAQDATLRAASLGATQPEGRNEPLAATTKAGTDAGADANADAVDAGTNDAPASTLFGADASVDSAGNASAASSTDATAARASHDFAAQLAHARAASASGAGLLESPRGVSAPPMHAPTHTPTLHAAAIATPLHAAAFPAHFAAEVAMLGAAGIERAEIQLQPPDLGPVRIELTLSGESTRVAFSAVQPETRQAIEQSLPILKDLLAERGLTLGDTSVS
ncbi:MAG: hypothetical protein DCC72_11860, partial [Burkholderiales bacterium]